MRRGPSGAALLCVGLALGCPLGGDADTATDAGTGTDTDAAASGTTGGTDPTHGTTTTNGNVATSDDDPPTDEGSSGSGTTGTGTTTSTTTTTTSPPDDDGGPPPLGPGCSVQVVTRGAEFDPLVRGEAGEFPAPVADVLEDYCGCHTLNDNSENLEWQFLLAPEGTLFKNYADLSRGFQSSTLGATIAAVTLQEMPPGSCPRPATPLAILTDWFAQGLPDGADYVE